VRFFHGGEQLGKNAKGNKFRNFTESPNFGRQLNTFVKRFMAMYSAYRFQAVELIPTKIIRMPMTPKLLDTNFPGVEVFGIDQRL